MRFVLDTNVLVAAMRSPSGASSALLRAGLSGRFILLATGALLFEYVAVLKRPGHLAAIGLGSAEMDEMLDDLVRVLDPVRIDFQWRPVVPDPDDDMVIEAAINGKADAIVTFETTTFIRHAERFGIKVLTPAQAWGNIKP